MRKTAAILFFAVLCAGPAFGQSVGGNGVPGANSGGGSPTGAAGGALGSTYPNPTVVGAITPSSVNGVILADAQTGADCGAKINAALTTIGANPGNVQMTPACGTISTGVTLGANQHIYARPGTYSVAATITLSGQTSSVYCDPTVGIPATNYGSCYFHQANSANLAEMFLLSGANASLVNVTVDGNVAQNPTGGPAVYITGIRPRLDYVNVINSPSHGVSLGTGVGNTAGAAKLSHVQILNNTGDGIHCNGSSDLFVGDQSEISLNGANGLNLKNCAGARIGPQNDISGNTDAGILVGGTATAAVSAYNNLITGNIFSNNGKNDVDIEGWDTTDTTYISLYSTVSNNIFQGSPNHGDGLYDAIHFNASGYNSIVDNVIQDLGSSSTKFNAGINLISGAATELADTVAGNTVVVQGTPIISVTSTILGVNNVNGAASALSGTTAFASGATTATNALNVETIPTTTSAAYYFPIVPYDTEAFQQPLVASNLTYNPSTGLLSVPSVSTSLINTTAPTQTPGDNSTKVATDAFVQAALPNVSVSSVFNRTGAVVATSGDYSFGLVSGTATAAQGGTGTTSLTGVRYANGGSADTAATTSQVQTAIGNGVYVPAGGYYGGTATGAVNVLAVTLPSGLGSPTLANLTGVLISFIPNLANTTTTPTLTVNSLAATTIVKGTSTALAAGDLALNTLAFVVYNGTNFQLINPQVGLTQTAAAGSLNLPSANCFSWNADTYLSRGSANLLYVGSSCGAGGGALTLGNETVTSYAYIANVNVSGRVEGNTTTQTAIYQGGQDASSASNLGPGVFRGANNGSTGAAGNASLEAGANSSTGQQGFANMQQSYTIAAVTTVGYVLSMTTTSDVVQVAPLAATNIVGVATTAGGSSAQIYAASNGKVLVKFDGTPVVGDFACGPPASTGTAGQAHDNGSTACTAGQKLGVVTGQVSGTGAGATATVLLQIGT